MTNQLTIEELQRYMKDMLWFAEYELNDMTREDMINNIMKQSTLEDVSRYIKDKKH